MLLLNNSSLEKIETWHVGLSCQYTHFMSFSSKSEHDTVADRATLSLDTPLYNDMKLGLIHNSQSFQPSQMSLTIDTD